MKFRHLLAKSSDTPRTPQFEETLLGHTLHVIEAAETIADTTAEQVAKLTCDLVDKDTFRLLLMIAAWLHDLGKANDHFQKMMRDRSFRQGIRHETLGVVVLADLFENGLRDFWSAHEPWTKSAVLEAISGHHLKFPDSQKRPQDDVRFLAGHQEMAEFWKLGSHRIGLTQLSAFRDKIYSLLPFGGIQELLIQIRRQYDFDATSHQKVLIGCLKSALMAADIAGSALPEKGKDIKSWLSERFKAVVEKHQIVKIVEQRLDGKKPRPFQKLLQEIAPHTALVEAGCGSGKTLAAYLWAAETGHGKRIFFCYPTTATASEGFSGYLSDPDFEALLRHSRASMDYRLLENMPSAPASERELSLLRLEALETWPIPVVVCTAHTVLGILQNVRRSLYAWPNVVRSVFVFDEIHAFSDKLFKHLLRFLEVFSSRPILLMTATLPPARKAALEVACQKRGGLHILQGPQNRERAKRYLLEVASEDTAWQETRQILACGGKVLWIANTVNRAMQRTRMSLDAGLPVQPYHSRYRYRDRLIRQRSVIDGFAPDRPPMLAITTQVAEMSLDLSADLLVTEYAPVPSLIQRLGRLNRFEEEPRVIKKAILFQPENALPYATKGNEESAFWQGIKNWLDRVADGLPRSQQELSSAFEELAEVQAASEESIFCDWLDTPWITLNNRHALMEAGHTIDIVREEDLQEGPVQENVIPMPFPKKIIWQHWEHKGRYLVAPVGTVEYDSFWGANYAAEETSHWII